MRARRQEYWEHDFHLPSKHRAPAEETSATFRASSGVALMLLLGVALLVRRAAYAHRHIYAPSLVCFTPFTTDEKHVSSLGETSQVARIRSVVRVKWNKKACTRWLSKTR